MKILLDENLPKRLKNDFSDMLISTVRDKNWQGTKNGQLLAKMISEKFDIFITFDKQIRYQQNLEKYPLLVIVLRAKSNSYRSLKPLVPQIRNILSQPLSVGLTEISTENF
jgi:predicted nuclease of predicted toxin-antitoxin system